jgi:RNA-directed DNA polymerase
VNTGEPSPLVWPDQTAAWARVLAMQTKLHRWAAADPGRRFDDLHNLVYDPAFLVAAWSRVRGNKGARTAGVDRLAPREVIGAGVAELLAEIRQDLKSGSFVPQRVREKAILRRRARSVASVSRPLATVSCRPR